MSTRATRRGVRPQAVAAAAPSASPIPRVDLGVRETPLEPLPRLTAALGGPQLYIKRDDLAGGPLGGNKTRMLEYVLAKAVAEGADGGGRWFGRPVELLRASSPPVAPGSARLPPRAAAVAPATTTPAGFAAPRPPLRRDDPARRRRPGGADLGRLTELADGLERPATWCTGRRRRARRQAAARRRLRGGAVELLDQAAAAGDRPDPRVRLVARHHPRRAAARASGPLVGRSRCGPSRRTNGRSSPTARSRRRSAGRRGGRTLLDLAVPITAADVDTSTATSASATATDRPEDVAALRLFARTEAIVLDPVYSAKAAAALVADVTSGELGSDRRRGLLAHRRDARVFAYADEIGRSSLDRIGVGADAPLGPGVPLSLDRRVESGLHVLAHGRGRAVAGRRRRNTVEQAPHGWPAWPRGVANSGSSSSRRDQSEPRLRPDLAVRPRAGGAPGGVDEREVEAEVRLHRRSPRRRRRARPASAPRASLERRRGDRGARSRSRAASHSSTARTR